jgi:hypothetical protein
MKTQDGGPVHRDTNFLAETKCVTREFADRRIADAQQTADLQQTATLSGDAPITLYTELLGKGTYTAAQYGTAQFGATTFGKMTNFTKPVADCTKDTSNE